MRLKGIEKVGDGRYLNKYNLTYETKSGKDKIYEIVSYNKLTEDYGESKVTGVSLLAFKEDRMLLLKEFRMGVNRYVYNLCAGMLEAGESYEQCARRELYEETGLTLTEVIREFSPCYEAVAISDIRTVTLHCRVQGEISEHTGDNEDITAGLYTREEVGRLLETEAFTKGAQIAAYNFINGGFSAPYFCGIL